MTHNEAHEIVLVSSQADDFVELAATHGGTLYLDDRPQAAGLSFRALLRLPAHAEEAISTRDTGVYRAICRTIKPGPVSDMAVFPMLRRSSLTHDAADAHWRDVHAPLALVHHAAMSQYLQLSITETLSGVAYDGIALCGFRSLDDLKNHFYSGEDSVQIIADDVRKFADTRRSPRRLITRIVASPQ
jgi:hypothetical protein